MSTPAQSPDAPARGRGAIAWTLVVIACLLMPIAVVAYWGQRTLTDTSTYVATVAPLVEEQAVQNAVVDKTTTTVMEAVKENQVVEEALSALPPAAVEKLKAPIEGAIQSLVTQVTTKIVESKEFADFWVKANTKVQQTLIQVLSGDPNGAVQIQGDEVVLDTAPIAKEVQDDLVKRGLTALEGKPLPAAADQHIVLLKSSELKQARTIYSFTVPLARYLIPVLALLVLVGVWVSRRRARLVMGIGIGVVLGMLVLSAGLAVGKTALADASPDSQAQSLLNVFWITLTRYLANGISAWLSVGVVVALIGWFGGRSKPATAVRAAISTSLVDAGHRFDGGDAIGSFARDHWRAVFIGLGALGTGSIFLFNPPSVAVVVWITIICLALAALVTFARGWGAGSDAGSPATPATAAPAAPTSA